MLKLIKDWMLPIAMITGALTYPWIAKLSFLSPYLIFAMLLLTFCKIPLKDIRFHPAHIWLLLIQLIGSAVIYFAIRPFDETLAQGAMICLLTPTATAAVVITGMLGGNLGFLTAYAMFCNIAIAVTAPVFFSLIGVHEEFTFFESVWYICRQIFPLLILPLFIAVIVRNFAPKVHRALLSIPNLTFYLWAFALTIATGLTVQFVMKNDNTDYSTEIGLAIISLILCCLQFIVGRRIGRSYGDPVSSGQGLGQKNTILAIWMAQSFLNPLVSVAPAAYILWQNIINSYQLWKRNHTE
ncbi:MAG: transporter [Tannerella sp.]|jgi:BASS family bile acid:Na+ symporter|nr:transporter [Tannerella sp.]